MAEYVKQPIVELETPRLLLRPLQESDAEHIQLRFPHWNVLKYMNAAIPWPYPEDGAMSFVQGALPKIEQGLEYYWVLLRKGHEGEGAIGVIGLVPASDEDHRGFWLGEEFWGRGYMKEAVLAVNDFGFDVLEMPEMLLGNAVANTASGRLKESAGAEIIATYDEQYIGGTLPTVKWRLLPEVWREKRKDW